MRRKTFMLMMKVFHRVIDGERGHHRLYAQANSVMKRTPYVEQSDDIEEDVIRVYDPTVPFVEPRRCR